MMRSCVLALLVGSCFWSTVAAQAAAPALGETYSPRLEKILTENIMAFWYPRCLDKENGGYTISFDAAGQIKPGVEKMIVTQSRNVWFFARAARAGYKKQEYLAAADHGYRFLIEKMWDQKNGGFYWGVDATGKPTQPRKHMYGQSFALYAISEYAMASGRKDVLDFAKKVFELLDAKTHDAQYGGYNEFFEQDWSSLPANTRTYMHPTNDVKLMNTHLHLMEAVATFVRASKLPLGRERLLELIAIESNSVVRKGLAACTDKYQPDWTPMLNGPWARVSYGHDVENVWLLMDACDAAGISEYPYGDLFRSIFAYSRKYGFDEAKGGFYDGGAFNQPADRRQKVWWVQAEGLVSALYMYRLTRDASYLEAFSKTLDFIEKEQVDWKTGEWHEGVAEDGTPRGTKGHGWKAAYHNGRAMIECLELIKKLDGGKR